MKSTRQHAPAVVAVALVSAGVFLNALRSEFIWDDNILIAGNEHIHTLQPLSRFLSPTYWAGERADPYGIPTRGFRPIPEITFALDYAGWELNEIGFHITSLLVHVVTSVLVYFLAYRLFGDLRPAVMAALIFATHPVHVEAVVYSKARPAAMALMFMLASMLLFMRWARRPVGRWAPALQLAGIVVFCGAAMSKETSVILPGLLLLWVWLFMPRNQLRRGLLAVLPFVAVVALYFALEASIPSPPKERPPVWGYYHFLMVVSTLGTYVRLFVLPLRLCLHPELYLPQTVLDPQVLKALPWLAALAAATVIAYRRSRPAFFSLGWIVVAMGPLSNVLIHGRRIAETRAYIPSVGFCILVALLLWRLPGLVSDVGTRRRLQWVGMVLCGLLVGVYAGLTIQRNMDWRDNLTLWGDTVRKNPRSWRAHHGLARTLYRLGRVEESMAELRKVVELHPIDRIALGELALYHDQRGEYDEALKRYRRLRMLNWRDVSVRVCMGIDYARVGQPERAEEEFEKALRLDPECVEALYNLGVLHITQEEYDGAISVLRKAEEIEPEDARVQHGLGIAYDKSGADETAVEHYARAVELAPEAAEAWLAMGACYEEMGERAEALVCFRRCRELGGPPAAEAEKRLEALTGTGNPAP